MAGVSQPFYTDKPRYTGENWRVVVISGASAANYGFKTEAEAQAFHNEQKETA